MLYIFYITMFYEEYTLFLVYIYSDEVYLICWIYMECIFVL